MKCPYCHEEMEPGYIQCRDGVSWNRKKRAVAALTSLGSSLILASGSRPLSGAAVVAFRCSHCSKIIIDYGDSNSNV